MRQASLLPLRRKSGLNSGSAAFAPAGEPNRKVAVERTDFAGKAVVLFTTGNSRFEPVEIDDFAKRVEANGGRFDRHVFLQRGRIHWQMSREELLAATREALSASKTPR